MVAAEVGSITASGECVKGAVEFGGKEEIFIYGCDFTAPEFREFGLQRSIK